MKQWILFLTLLSLTGCTTIRVMKDCEHKDGAFWQCKEP